jgi:DsbC/DsbD-like thiol-disulfide interchange protein
MLGRLTTTCLAALFAAAFTPTPTLAQFEGRSVDEVVQVSLIEGWRMENGRHMAGIRIALAPGWKTYWRAPGEGGVPTVLRLRSAEGIEGMAIHWPRPEVFFTNGMRSIGYRDDVVLPVEFAVPVTARWTLMAGWSLASASTSACP